MLCDQLPEDEENLLTSRKAFRRHCGSLGTQWGSDQGCAEQYREKIPGGERWQEARTSVVTGINRDVRQEGLVLIELVMREDNQYSYFPPWGTSKDSCPQDWTASV